jgi:hypothetical protein
VSWEKIGVTIVTEPKAHGSGIYLRVPKNVVDAYELVTAEKIEVTIDRAKRRTPVEEETDR